VPSLDTNVLVRFLVADDPRQHRIAVETIAGATEELFIPMSVTVELEWVLRSRYGLDKSDIIEVFAKLLESRDVEFQTEAAVEVAINLYQEHNVDFADCLHIATAFNEVATPFFTFDRKASKLHGAELL